MAGVMGVYKARERGGARSEGTHLGSVWLDGEGRMERLGAAVAALDEAIADMNGCATLFHKLPPGPGAAKFSIRKVEAVRGTPEFLGALQDNLRRWHDIELVAE